MDNFGNPNSIEDFQAMLVEVDAQLMGISKRGQVIAAQLKAQISEQAREIARLNTELSGCKAELLDAKAAPDAETILKKAFQHGPKDAAAPADPVAGERAE